MTPNPTPAPSPSAPVYAITGRLILAGTFSIGDDAHTGLVIELTREQLAAVRGDMILADVEVQLAATKPNGAPDEQHITEKYNIREHFKADGTPVAHVSADLGRDGLREKIRELAQRFACWAHPIETPEGHQAQFIKNAEEVILSVLQTVMEAKEQEYRSQKENADFFYAQTIKQQSELTALREQSSRLLDERNRAEKNLDEVCHQHAALVDEVASLRGQLAEAEKRGQEHFDAYQGLYAEYDRVRKCAELDLKAWQEAQVELASLRERLADAEQRQRVAEERIAALTKDRDGWHEATKSVDRMICALIEDGVVAHAGSHSHVIWKMGDDITTLRAANAKLVEALKAVAAAAAKRAELGIEVAQFAARAPDGGKQGGDWPNDHGRRVDGAGNAI